MPVLGSNLSSFCFLWNQVLEVLSENGMRRPRVHIVSSIKPSEKLDLSVESGNKLKTRNNTSLLSSMWSSETIGDDKSKLWCHRLPDAGDQRVHVSTLS